MDTHVLLLNAIAGVTCAFPGCELTPEEEYCPLHEEEMQMECYDLLLEGNEYLQDIAVDQARGKE